MKPHGARYICRGAVRNHRARFAQYLAYLNLDSDNKMSLLDPVKLAMLDFAAYLAFGSECAWVPYCPLD
jgi:hypothetical protein